MPDRTISILGYSTVALIVAYLALVIVTVSLAAWQTDLAVAVHEVEGDIQELEKTYYDTVARLDSTDPGTVGLVAPTAVRYAAKIAAPAVSFR